ncbi:hypothetical protein L6452_24693 [Arctium lappa]|uniref:Uncharacterized protein n=1 Tax=Arctium lappa TaxID=4217 RepID=A0ACB9AB42_ARCLA|nr:hypothetical protein L6452_24693 [Arctium lappa]
MHVQLQFLSAVNHSSTNVESIWETYSTNQVPPKESIYLDALYQGTPERPGTSEDYNHGITPNGGGLGTYHHSGAQDYILLVSTDLGTGLKAPKSPKDSFKALHPDGDSARR